MTRDPIPPFTVAQLAELGGVTARTLRHYDRIGLLAPGARSDAAYRLYGAAELERLREILVFRRLGVPLARIAELLDDPDADRAAVLRTQRDLVHGRIAELHDLARALDRALNDEGGPDMVTDRDIIEALDGFDPAEHEAEARERWGATGAHAESARRTRAYTADDWRAINAEADAVASDLADAHAAGEDPASIVAMEAAEAHRAHVTRWFYDCSAQIHRDLGEMYVADPRFAAYWDERAPDLAEWVRDAFAANADRLDTGTA